MSFNCVFFLTKGFIQETLRSDHFERTEQNLSQPTIGVPVPAELFLRLADFLRQQNDGRDAVTVVSDAIEYWLVNADAKPELLGQSLNEDSTGYQWKHLFLPHQTQLRMQYRDQYYYAVIEKDKMVYQGRETSPGSMVNEISGTSRSAWRDLWFKRPSDNTWLPASEFSKERQKQVDLGNRLLDQLTSS